MSVSDQPVSGPNGGEPWMIGLLRATTFIPTLTMDGAIQNSGWDETVDVKLDDERINHQNGVKEQTGSLNGNRLVMVSQPSRVDWILEAVESPPDMPKIPVLGPLSAGMLDPFMNIVKNWLSKCKSINRLAFGATLVIPTENARAGYVAIRPYLRNMRLDLQDTSDFFYRINRPKKSTVSPGIMINRLSSWSVELVGTVGVTVEPTASKVAANVQGQHICRLDLDINTALLDDGIIGDNAYSIFEELVAYGQKIAAEGDVV